MRYEYAERILESGTTIEKDFMGETLPFLRRERGIIDNYSGLFAVFRASEEEIMGFVMSLNRGEIVHNTFSWSKIWKPK